MPKPATEIDLAGELDQILGGPCQNLPDAVKGLMRSAFISGAMAVLDAIEDDDSRFDVLVQIRALLPTPV